MDREQLAEAIYASLSRHVGSGSGTYEVTDDVLAHLARADIGEQVKLVLAWGWTFEGSVKKDGWLTATYAPPTPQWTDANPAVGTSINEHALQREFASRSGEQPPPPPPGSAGSGGGTNEGAV